MLIVDESTYFIHLTAGDNGTVGFTLDATLSDESTIPYEFQPGDKVTFYLKHSSPYSEYLEKDMTIDFEENVSILSFIPEDTAKLPPGKYKYSCKIVCADNNEKYTFIENAIFEVGDQQEDL